MEFENKDFYSFDLREMSWNVIRAVSYSPNFSKRGEDPVHRDEHSAVVFGDQMIIFGGFKDGDHSNSMFSYCFSTNQWERIHARGKVHPVPRAGHSAAIW